MRLSVQELEESPLYSEELGIQLRKQTDAEYFKWFLASLLFGGRISEAIAGNTYRAFARHRLLSPRKILKAGWKFLVNPVMREGGYVRYDERKSTQILNNCEMLLADYGGSLTKLHEASADSGDLERRLLRFFGVGPVTVNIFLREMRPYWPLADPAPLAAICELAGRYGIELDKFDRKSEGFVRIEAGLIRAWHVERRRTRRRTKKGEFRIARCVGDVTLSAIKQMAMLSAKTEGAVSLAWGVPSFETPRHIRRAVAARFETDPHIGMYSLPDGLPELREAITREHLRQTGIEVDPERHVMITAGNMEGVRILLQTIVEPGDEVIVTDPGFASHIVQIRLCGGEPVYWKLDEDRGWRLDVDALEELVTERTRAIILVTPSNPTGAIFPEEELRRVGTIAAEHNLLIVLDDPYHHFTYENRALYFNLASVSELRARTAYLFTFSKTFAMTGWRLGYMIVPAALKREVIKVHDATIICAPRISQAAALVALTEEPTHLAEFTAILARRRKLICDRLDHLPHIFQYVRPEGAYYVFPRIVAEHTDAFEFSTRLLEDARVAVTPGGAFGPAGEHHVRMAYCTEGDAIETAFDRLERYFGHGQA